MTTPRKSMMAPRSPALAAVVGAGPVPAEDEDEPTPAPQPKAKAKARKKPPASLTSEPAPKRTVTVEAPTWTPPVREVTEQLNVRIPKSQHDWVKDRHRTTGEPMRSIVERALTLLQQTEENS